MSESTFQRAAVIGTGMMGPGIAATLALGGAETTIVSRAEESARSGLNKAFELLDLLDREGLIDTAAAEQARRRLSASASLASALKDTEFVVESAPEDMLFKQGLFAEMDHFAPPQAILASNTSGLSITAIASRCKHPERVLTTHFWNPPHLMPLVEVVIGDQTGRQNAEAVRAFLLRCGKTPVIVKKDRPGQLGNRLQMAMVREAVNIVAEGIADAEDVDLAARTGFGLRMPAYGILEHQDIVGLELGFRVVDYVVRDLNNEPKAPALYNEKMSRGEFGAKSGKGFYDWSTRSAEEVCQRRDRFLIDYLRGARTAGGAK